MLIVQLGEFLGRGNFGDFLNRRNLLGTAVEIGTHRAVFAEKLLSQWRGMMLYCIDPWRIPPGYESQAEMLKRGCSGADSREADYAEALRVIAPYTDRCKTITATSEQGVKQFASDGCLDFVYLDGDHRREHVLADLKRWWPKLRHGGVMAGHDLICPGEHLGGWGSEIQPAVFEFAYVGELTIHLVVEPEGLPWSFYLIKK